MTRAPYRSQKHRVGFGYKSISVYYDYFWFLVKGKEYSGIGFLAQLVAGEVPGLEVELGSLLHAEHYLKLNR